ALLEARGEYGAAEQPLRDALAMYQKLFPPARFPSGHPLVATSLDNLGSLLAPYSAPFVLLLDRGVTGRCHAPVDFRGGVQALGKGVDGRARMKEPPRCTSLLPTIRPPCPVPEESCPCPGMERPLPRPSSMRARWP